MVTTGIRHRYDGLHIECASCAANAPLYTGQFPGKNPIEIHNERGKQSRELLMALRSTTNALIRTFKTLAKESGEPYQEIHEVAEARGIITQAEGK